MATKGIKVINKITKPTLKKQHYSGATLEDVAKKMDQNKAGQVKCWGLYAWDLKHDYNFDGSGHVTDVTLTGTTTITMPIWKEWNKADRESQKTWDIMWVKLKRHEERHHEKTLAAIKKLEGEFKRAKPMKEQAFNKRMVKFFADLQKLQNDYDKSSKNGQSEGVKL